VKIVRRRNSKIYGYGLIVARVERFVERKAHENETSRTGMFEVCARGVGRVISRWKARNCLKGEKRMIKQVAQLALVTILLSSFVTIAQKNNYDVPVAPLPAVIVNAKKVFLSNGGGSNLAYDAFYSDMKDWGKYQIVGSPDEADLIIELAYRVEDKGTRVWSTTNTYNNTTQVHS
jgi:hypothetical protein